MSVRNDRGEIDPMAVGHARAPAGEWPTVADERPLELLARLEENLRSLMARLAETTAERDRLRDEVTALRRELEAAGQELARREGYARALAEMMRRGLPLEPQQQPAPPPARAALVPCGSNAGAQDQTTGTVEASPYQGPSQAGASRRRRRMAIRSRQGRRGSGWVVWTSRCLLGAVALAIALVLAASIGPLALPYRDYFVLSGSMEPKIPVGSLVVLRQAAADQLRVGDIITFRRPDNPSELVTHRIYAVESGPSGRAFVTKGDANAVPDPWRVPAAGRGWIYAFHVPYLGYGLAALSEPLGRLILLVVPATALAAWSLFDIWRPRPQVREAA